MSADLVHDPDTGVFSEAMLRAVLPSRVATARRTLRQLGLVLVDIEGPSLAEATALVLGAVRDSDIAARLDDGTWAFVLEFTPAEGCMVVVRRLRDRVLELAPDGGFRAGVACYPAHAISADELVSIARAALESSPERDGAVAPIPD